MSLSEKEKKCFSISSEYLADLARQAGIISDEGSAHPVQATEAIFVGTLAGNLAADKFRECMHATSSDAPAIAPKSAKKISR